MKLFKLLTVAILATSISFLTGCAHTNADGTKTPVFNLNAQTGGIVAQIAAKDGTTIALQRHPEWRMQFQQAFNELNVLANADKVDIAAVAAIINQLPVKQLQGTTAKLIIGDVQIVVQALTSGGAILSQDQYSDAKIIIGAIRDGVKMGLDATAPQASISLPAASEALTPLAEMSRKRDGTNFLGVYMGMIALLEKEPLKKWDVQKACYCGETIPIGVQMYSATSGSLLRWIPYTEFKAVYIDKTQSEYPRL